MNRKCNNSYVILCVRTKDEKDRTAMLVDWAQALKLVKQWTGLELTREDFEEDEYEYKPKPLVTERERAEKVKNMNDRESLFRDGQSGYLDKQKEKTNYKLV